MFYVWAVVNPDGVPVVESIESDRASAIDAFLRTRPDKNGVDLDWNGWQVRGFRCERFSLIKEDGLER